MKVVAKFLGVVVLPGLVVAACGTDGSVDGIEVTGPTVLKMNKSALTVGESVSFYGVNFLLPEDGTTKLVFEGTFAATELDGSVTIENVPAFTVAPVFDGIYYDGGNEDGIDLIPGEAVLRWNRFGPFQVPFSKAGNKPGRFSGTVQAVNTHNDGTVTMGEPTDVTIDVEASLVIKKLEPIVAFPEEGGFETANCGGPAVRGIAGLAYVMQVEAVGFEPRHFFWQVHGIEGPQDGTEYHHVANGRLDSFGDFNVHPDDPPVVLRKLADGEGFNIAAISVTAVDAENNTYHTALPLTVVRPMGFHYDGNKELAEYYPPEVVNGPIPGAIGSSVTYAESHSETRQRGVSFSMSNTFVATQGEVDTETLTEGISTTNTQSSTNSIGQSHSETENSSETYGTTYNSSESNSVDFSTKEGANWGWNTTEDSSSEEYSSKLNELSAGVNTEISSSVTGEGSVPGFAKVSGTVGTKFGAEVGAKTGNTTGEKTQTGESHGNHMYNSTEESKAYGSVTTDGKSETLSGTYGLSKQSTINESKSETEATSESTSFAMGKAKSVSEQVSQGETQSWSETFVNTSQDTHESQRERAAGSLRHGVPPDRSLGADGADLHV